jgi:hypothetical protein
MANLLGLVAAFLVALFYRGLSTVPVPMGGIDLLGLALCAGLAALVGAAFGDYLEARRQRKPFNRKLFDALVPRNLVFAGVTGWFVTAVAVYVAGPYYDLSTRG